MTALEQLLKEHSQLSDRFRELNTAPNGAPGFAQNIRRRLCELETSIATIARPCTHELDEEK